MKVMTFFVLFIIINMMLISCCIYNDNHFIINFREFLKSVETVKVKSLILSNTLVKTTHLFFHQLH